MRAPINITTMETTRTNDEPPDLRRTGIKKTPNTAPNFPIDAAMPDPWPLTSTGKTFEGSTYVIRCGPMFKKSSKLIKAPIEIQCGQLYL